MFEIKLYIYIDHNYDDLYLQCRTRIIFSKISMSGSPIIGIIVPCLIVEFTNTGPIIILAVIPSKSPVIV